MACKPFRKSRSVTLGKNSTKKLGFHTALGACETRQRHALCAVCRWEPKERKSCAAKGHCHQFSQMGHQKYHGHGDDSQRSCLVQNSISGKLEETPVRNSQSSFTSVLTKDQRYTCAMVKPSDDGCAQNLHQIVTY